MSENKRELGQEDCAYRREETGAYMPIGRFMDINGNEVKIDDMKVEYAPLERLEQQVIQWAHDKGIMAKATPIKQGEKTGEEYAEMMAALGKQAMLLEMLEYPSRAEFDLAFEKEVKEEIKDAIGDQVVTLIIQCAMQGLTLAECLQSAYDIIAKRTGKMVDGKFVKDK